ncbi:MAG: DeoR/GlpR family DNA-binding transcription regulator, partial [Planctomycetota bacterium]
MKKQEIREANLIEMLKTSHRLAIADVIEHLGISEATARRLFAKLESEKKLIRTHGGIQATPELRSDYSFLTSAASRNPEKEKIGRKAAEKVKNNDQLFLDAGTTVLKMAEALAFRIQKGELKNIIVFTNSLSLTNNLAGYCEVILIGGKIRPERRDVCGPLARQNLEKYRFDKVFCGVDAISSDGELMTTDPETAEINALFISRS